ncbi:helicase-related protein [Brevibacillus borstelensis]|uniref:helicase-related protein n=1 Tax=Brevibacillus borstelensis TaxID=45462 RepID=UPI001D0B1BC9|nr:helicase-related protein [Brevibacillus borstelensis]MCC0567179.1 DEAD/DEAH box helicase family protein [Brevibacillus borstelensis]
MTLATESKWLKRINPNVVDLYPLQFANVERLNSFNNDVVYIFDEVGSGKTISSGIMALDFLERNPNEKVLVITTNALAQSNNIKPNGQFIGDWFDKLPFEDLDYNNRVKVVNNHHSKFKYKQDYGLVIIDEAHLFLSQETQRHRNLVQNISAKKVVFLTATPIKQHVSDLKVYPRIAEALIKKKVDDSWISQLHTSGKKPEELICSQFDVQFPVTRYFKDTIKSLQTEGYKKTQAKRYETLTWKYQSYSTKNEVLVENLRALYDKSKDNRFVIFTRYVVKEADVIGEYLESAGFVKSTKEIPDKTTYYIVTGRNPQELADFSKLTDLPTVLILTYQIAEQGINLPGYNHIVNYHISAYPSALEQRYGRIDRLNSQSESIYNCFLISSKYFDTNTFNFYCAINTCLGSLLSYLPSRNTILSPEILKSYTTLKNEYEKYIARISGLLEGNMISKLYDCLVIRDASSSLSETDGATVETTPVITDEELIDLYEFCREISLDEELKGNRVEAVKSLLKDIHEQIDDLSKGISHNSAEKEKVIEWLLKDRGIWDHIFYTKEQSFDWSQREVGRVDAVEECANFISNNSNYETYRSIFNEQVRLPKEFQKYRDQINRSFEEAFEGNEFDKLFPDIVNSTYKEKFPEIAQFSTLVLENLEQLVSTLPFWRMVNQFKSELFSLALTESGFTRENFAGDTHVFATAMGRLSSRDLGLSKEFYNKYFGHIIGKQSYYYKDEYQSFFKVAVVQELDEDGVKKKVSAASNWLKLAYHTTRKESLSCTLKHSYGNRYHLSCIFEPKGSYFTEKGELIVSLFSYFIRRNSGGFRTWAEKYLVGSIPRAEYVWSNDYWTKGILETVNKQSFN